MKKPSKSKAVTDVRDSDGTLNVRKYEDQQDEREAYARASGRAVTDPRTVAGISPVNEPTDAETLCALQFALAPLDRAMLDADVESWPRHRTVFPSILQSAEDERRERDRDLEYESRVDYASWETDQPERQEDA